ncbi:MAG TPA: alpha/beta hydrolase [Ferruginibacter sp.]|nr:alpha/beta hydrolase [Ferruginibacter sp.]HMP19582.1 alpha/beta hydrolase [Ferruginibacter sp.]
MKKIIRYTIRTAMVLFILLNIITAFHAYKFTHFYEAAEAPVVEKSSLFSTIGNIVFGAKAYKKNNTVPADSTYETIYLATKDGIQIECWYRPVAEAKGTVILFHGHGSKKSSVNDEAAGFNKMGYNTLQADFRAHGGSGGNTCTIGWYEVEDVKLAYDWVKAKGESDVVLWGISMGAATITKAIDDYKLRPKKIILEMPFATLLEAAEGRIKMMGLPPEPLAVMVTFWGGIENGFWAFNMKPAQFVRSIKCPVLLQWGENDNRVKKDETTRIFTNITAPKKLVLYANSGHESLCSNETDKWMNETRRFLLK